MKVNDYDSSKVKVISLTVERKYMYKHHTDCMPGRMVQSVASLTQEQRSRLDSRSVHLLSFPLPLIQEG